MVSHYSDSGATINNAVLREFKGVCLNCVDRHVGCHSECEKYIAARKRADIVKADANRKSAEHSAVLDVRRQAWLKIREEPRKELVYVK